MTQKSKSTKYLIVHYHLQVLHGGKEFTISKIKERLWIVDAKYSQTSEETDSQKQSVQDIYGVKQYLIVIDYVCFVEMNQT